VRHLVEETYEAIEAIDQLSAGGEDAAAALEEELGDVLCQVLFHSRLAAEEGLFTLADVARTLADKLVGRHPHVFGDATAPDAEAVLSSWERSKLVEKGRSSVMEGIPAALPALLLAEKVEKKATTVGLAAGEREDGADLGALLACLGAGDADEETVGALLLGITARCAAAGIDSEAALRRAAARLRDQVALAEQRAASEGTDFSSLPPAARLERFREARLP
jgi:XTP/dITP diphosphohydrolase